ncbi:transposase [Anabaena sp. FACHB-1250]|uniref:Transposase n=1 Tax=Dolichospermum flos-aquae LEGE 04289 TaxID=1828708 RepID=A0ACC5Q1I1_DOLFA|nr:zinc ribbon domain-containing protein [Anabaena sp. FACHB-1391]MBD2141428.1 transposase [Anabaena sp. FACHB-1250]MBD2270601.1 transposase [Anabaena sp. FACHB-1391]MBE9219170.1 transposase [Dolichospermum flos-aquae LEGE 04289]MCW9681262.1 transposase [Dolichospermum planctonicum UHCC 0167]
MSERVFKCDSCEFKSQRHWNAAINLSKTVS